MSLPLYWTDFDPVLLVESCMKGLTKMLNKALNREVTDKPMSLAIVPNILAWENIDLKPFETRILTMRRNKAQQMVGEIMQLDSSIGSFLQDALSALPESRASRFLCAPETSHRLECTCTHPGNVLFFRDALAAEGSLIGHTTPPFPCWTALGDFYFTGADYLGSQNDLEGPHDFIAPRTFGSIPIDLVSPNARFLNSMANSPFEAYTTQEIPSLCADLNQAITMISQASPAAARLITTFVKVIIYRKETARLNRVGSSSTPSHIGRLLLRNGHVMDVGMLADALVHESVHALLFTIECFHPFAPRGSDVTILSPWSDNPLPLWIYLQACFVWYALANFWIAATSAEAAFSTETRSRHLSKALAGFRVGNPADRMRQYSNSFITKEILDVAASLKSELGATGALD
jgi:hypothetical protein